MNVWKRRPIEKLKYTWMNDDKTIGRVLVSVDELGDIISEIDGRLTEYSRVSLKTLLYEYPSYTYNKDLINLSRKIFGIKGERAMYYLPNKDAPCFITWKSMTGGVLVAQL